MIEKFLRSPLRAYRWLFGFLGVTLVFMFITFCIEANADVRAIFYLPLLLLIIPCAYLGFVAKDDRLKRIIDLIVNFH
jgi:hypothetical protein